jgi:glutaminyl-peptide cyclotransferase
MGIALLAALGLAAFLVTRPPAAAPPAPAPAAAATTDTPRAARVHGYRIVKTFPHDRRAFTQGLIYLDDVFYESTGLYEESTLRKVAIETGDVLQKIDVPGDYFAEGLVEWDTTLVQLTWTTGVAFVYDRASFKKLRQHAYTGEGWGLTRTDTHLVMSDGTPTVRLLDPKTFAVAKRIQVHDENGPVSALNELEMVKGTLFANVWTSERIAMIDLDSGRVTGWLDLTGLLPAAERSRVDVMNGIAYDAAGDRLFVTGKWWPHVYQIQITDK